MRPRVKAEGSPKPSERTVGSTNSTPWEEVVALQETAGLTQDQIISKDLSDEEVEGLVQ